MIKRKENAISFHPQVRSASLRSGIIIHMPVLPFHMRIAFEGAIKVQPGSDAAKAAQAELDRLGGAAQRK
jgi:hypothetical protein